MNKLASLLAVLMISTSLLAQAVDSSAPPVSVYSGTTMMKYCAGIEALSASLPARTFAQFNSSLGPSFGWIEFEDRAAWIRAGELQPMARVWYRDGEIARVVMTSNGGAGQAYADYCYPPDGTLAEFRSLPIVHTKCDQSLLHCDITLRGGLQVYPPKGMAGARRLLIMNPVQVKSLGLSDFPFSNRFAA